MCKHLLTKGYSVYVHNRTKKKATPLINHGAIWCKTPKEVAQIADVVFIMVGFPNEVKEIILGSNGVLKNIKNKSTIIDNTTSTPELATAIYKKAIVNDIFFLDAPVSGGEEAAQNGKLAIMVGGDKSIYDKNLHLLNLLGNNIAYMGNAGFGQHTKLSNQILLAGTILGVIESLLYAKKMKINLDKLINIINKGAARSWGINFLGKKILNKDFSPGFFIKHFVKDMGIALDEAERINLSLPGLSIIRQFYISAMAMGYENLGIQALYKVLEKIN